MLVKPATLKLSVGLAAPPGAEPVGGRRRGNGAHTRRRPRQGVHPGQRSAAKPFTEEPKKLRELRELFWIEAAKNNVLPLDNSKIERMNVDNRPSLTRGRAVFTYYPSRTRIPEGRAPSILNKWFK